MIKFTSVDVETSGRSNMDEIISIGLVKFENNKIIDKFYTLIKPNKPIDPSASHINGIYNKDVMNEKQFNEVYKDIKNFIGNDILVAHNASFDFRMLKNDINNINEKLFDNDYICTMLLSKALNDFSSHSLDNLTYQYDIDLTNAHNALADAKATGILLVKLIEENNVNSLVELINKAGYKKFGNLAKNNRFAKK